MHRIRGQIQHYAWGDPTTLPHLLDQPPDGQPWAEYWLGTHQRAPSVVIRPSDTDTNLEDLTGPLPYLFKVLAAREALSLQVHPDAATALEGFTAEENRGVALDDPGRRFADPDPKPELICALEPFEALCGFAPDDIVDSRCEVLGTLGAEIRRRRDLGGRRDVVAWLLGERPDLTGLVENATRFPDSLGRHLPEVLTRWPGDPAGAVAVLMNHVSLAPAQALASTPGLLHAYLRGTGVEVMGPSDNVIRGGWTTKPVDATTLVALLDDAVAPNPIIDPVLIAHPYAEVVTWPTPTMPFRLERWTPRSVARIVATATELWWCERPDPDLDPRDRNLVVLAEESVVIQPGSVWFRTRPEPS
jgi:mannose-6-phosphate isomerase